jgi:serine/threonine-protein kinase RsbW
MARDTETPSSGEADDHAGPERVDDPGAGPNVVAVVPSSTAEVNGKEPPVRLLIPSSVRHLRLARVTASTMASDLSFDLQDIEDLRVAVDELAAILIQDCPPDAVLELRFDAVDGGLRINGQITVPGLPAAALHPVARELLELVADEYAFSPSGDSRSFELVKRRRRPEA